MTYKCGFCDKEFNSAEERMLHEQDCFATTVRERERIAKEKEEAEKKKLEAQREAERKKAEEGVRLAYQNYMELLNEYNQKYKKPKQERPLTVFDELMSFLDGLSR